MAGNQKRSLRINPTFIDGIADGWAFRVSEAFRAALDIALTQRILQNPRRVTSQWTQGSPPVFAFDVGDLLHHAADDALTVQVQRTFPDGTLSFDVYHGPERMESHTVTQAEFARILQEGLPPCQAKS